MEVHKVVLCVVDFEGLGLSGVVSLLKNTRYPNYCIAPDFVGGETRDCGGWHDDHPLNQISTFKAEFDRLFGDTPLPTQQEPAKASDEFLRAAGVGAEKSISQREPDAWAISYDGKTPYQLWPEGDGPLLDLEIKRLGGSACKLAIFTGSPATAHRQPLTPEKVNAMAESHGINGDARHWYVLGLVDCEAQHNIKEQQ